MPAGGISLFSGASDIGGFRHDDLGASPAARLPDNPEAIRFDYGRKGPGVVWYAGHFYDDKTHDGFAPYFGVSTYGGASFSQLATLPAGKAGGGRVAISTTDCDRSVWDDFFGTIWVTTDRGAFVVEGQGR